MKFLLDVRSAETDRNIFLLRYTESVLLDKGKNAREISFYNVNFQKIDKNR